MNRVGSGGQIFVGCRSVLSQFRVVRKFAEFCQKPLDLARLDRILTWSCLTLWVQAGSQQIGQKIGDFPLSSGPISTDQSLILTDWIENGRFSFEFKPDINRSDNKWVIFWSDTVGLVKYSFSASNPLTNSSFSSSGSRDPPPTRHQRRVAGSRAGLDGLGGWVRFQIWLDTLNSGSPPLVNRR